MSASSQDEQRRVPAPKVAVIIPCFNHSKYIEECILSVVKQDYPVKAIFFSDEGSTDDSWQKVLDLTNDKTWIDDKSVLVGTIEGTRIVLSQNPNPNGPSGARNRLIKLAWEPSDLFCMLDADDYYLPGKISQSVYTILEDLDSIGLVYTDAIIHHDNKDLNIREYREPYSRMRLEQECIISNTPMISKKALEISGLYDESMRTAEDWDLWLRITERFVASHIPEALHVYRVTGNNSSNTVPVEIWNENWHKIRERINGRRN